MIKIYNNIKGNLPTLTYHADEDSLERLGYNDSFELCDDLEDIVRVNYPDMFFEDECIFDPDSTGFMVFCTSDDVAQTVKEELLILMDTRAEKMKSVKEFEGKSSVPGRLREIADMFESDQISHKSMLTELLRLIRKESE